MPSPMSAPVVAWLSRLSSPRLFLFTGALFVVNLVVPDPIPFVDEVVLGLATLLLTRRKRTPPPPADDTRPPIDGQARRP